MGKRAAVRLTLTCVALALFAAFVAGARASRGSLRAAPAAGDFVLTDFGAVGDGVTDDGPALQAALDALAAAGGGTLHVPAGRYAIVTPVSKNFGGLAAPVKITGVPSNMPPAPPTAGGQDLTRGLSLTSEFLPRTGETAVAISISNLQTLSVEELAFVGTPGVSDDTLVTLLFHDVGEAAVRHCEFYGLASLNGAVVMARRSSLRFERSVVLGCSTSSGTYSSVIQNLEWKGVSVTDSIFADYGQRPELFGKMNLAAPLSWVNLGNAAAVTPDSPRREAVFRSVFFDEGGMSAISSMPDFYQPPSAPIDLVYVSLLRMNVSNLNTSGLYLTNLRGALVEDGRFGWSHNSDAAARFINAGSAILSRVVCADSVTRVFADAATARFVAIDAACPEILSQSPATRVFTAATADDDPTRYVRARFQAALARDPDPAAHYYWADRILRCGTDAACVTSARAALAAYLASNPQPTFTLEGRATDETGAPVAGAAIFLTGSQAVSTATDADGRYRFRNLPTSGVYTVIAEKRHHVFANPQQTVTTPAGARTVNFNATVTRFQVGGRLLDDATRGIAGVTVTLSGSRSATTTTDPNGYYTFSGLAGGGNYTVTPDSTRYTFTPVSQSVGDLSAETFIPFNATPRFHAISGQLFGSDGAALGGVSVALGGSKVATATTNPQGVFLFTDVPRGGSYTVTPGPALGYTFNPASRSFGNLTADQGGTYTGTPTNFKIAGRATANGAALAGVNVAVTGSRTASATTDANGAYSLALPVNGSYTLTPTRQHYTFAPASATVNPLASDRTADFAATLNRHKITGRVARPNGQAMSGVTVTLSGAQSATATTDSNGSYSFANLPAGGDYTVTPARAGYDFNPKSRAFAGLGADQTADFAVTPANVAVAGRVTSGGAGVSGVTVTLSGSRSATATTDSNGAYSFTVSSEGTYTVTPSKTHHTFAPQSQTFTNPVADRAADFAATLNRHTISGRVTRAGGAGVGGATVTLSGSQTATTTTDANGNYALTGVAAGGNYTVTASKANNTISPASASFTNLAADRTADFTATLLNYTVAGRVTTPGGSPLSGVAVALTGSQARTATTDANGAYSFNVPAEGDYAVTPSRQNYSFTPAAASFRALDGNKTADFAAALNRHAVRGRVVDLNNNGLPGVPVALSGSQSATTTTDAKGEFVFANLDAGGSYTVTPALPVLVFSPASQTFNNLAGDAFSAFVGTLAKYRISGRVAEQGAPLAGVLVELAGTHPALGTVGARVTTGDDGAYSFEVTAGGDYSVAPSKKNYSFAPASAAFKGLVSDRAADFAAAPLPTFEFGAATYAVGEGGGSVTVTVTRNGDAAHEATVVYRAVGDTARRGSDFIGSVGQLTFAPGETSKTFEVFITDDAFVEAAENFSLTLTPGEGASDSSSDAAQVTITDNDAAPANANPIEDDEFFVRQHYRDFFNREPDAEGLAFWTGEIRKCGADALCREARRISVSAAFFLSIEFQETGFLVYKLYKAAYGRAPERVEEFMLDARVMGEGVVVGRAGWELRLASNKAAAFRAFVERPQFASLYPATMTPVQFVEALFRSAGVTPTDAERQAAVDDFAEAQTSADLDARALALRRVAESQSLNQQEVSRAFVLMQYFGYLRRNPDETPDTNLDGYNNWLKKLNEFGGDYERAEMVKAFLSSFEYRGRFGN